MGTMIELFQDFVDARLRDKVIYARRRVRENQRPGVSSLE